MAKKPICVTFFSSYIINYMFVPEMKIDPITIKQLL
jgi:hypothetical protein